MQRRFENYDRQLFWELHVDDDETVTVTVGPIGSEGELEVIDRDASPGPPQFLLAEIIGSFPPGTVEILPDDLLERVQAAHKVTLTGRIRDFYANHEYKQYQGRLCPVLDSSVDFVATCVQYAFDQEYYDSKARKPVLLLPLTSKRLGPDFDKEDEQQWIGHDPSLSDGPIYSLFTSGEYEIFFPNLDAFLASLVPAV